MKNLYRRQLLIMLSMLSGIFYNAQSNQYLHFDGVDDYAVLNNASQYVNGSNTMSITGWFKNDVLGYGQGMMGFRGEGSGSGAMYLLQLGTGKVECRVITTTGTYTFQAPAGSTQAGVWQHWAWVFNQSSATVYIDGVAVGSVATSGTFSATNKPFAVGKTIAPGYNFVYKGGIDEVTLWNKALTQAEIQNMISNELTGNETGLVLYYKFNQGTPTGNNTSITQAIDQSGNALKNMDLVNMALTGNASNFIGTLNAGVQAINFPAVGAKLISDPPFQLTATTNSNLPITYTVVSGPATVSGSTLTLNGSVGTVTLKASQAGDINWQPAPDVFTSFDVVDPAQVLPTITALHPLSGNVYMPSLMPIEVAVKADISYPSTFSISNLYGTVNGVNIPLTDHGNGYYSGWWTPTQYGAVNLDITGVNNYGAQTTLSVPINLWQGANDISVNATTNVWVSGTTPSATVEADLPSHIGAYSQIMGTLAITCPTGGCDPWDRISSIEVMNKEGEWFEIIRYLTPYGVPCGHSIDLTDFASFLKGKTKFRVNLGTTGNGFQYTLQLNYTAGAAQYPYSKVEKLWTDTYQFGDLGNLQPVPQVTKAFPQNTSAAKLKLVSTGHGWGDNNTNNAAEFSNNTHHIWVNNVQTFTQNNWKICNPNPDGCSPQNGTWYYPRAGWCPGSIAPYYDYDMSSYITQPSVDLKYVFDTSYVDYCSPNNPSCVTGVTCPNCNDGFNPHLIVNALLVTYGTLPLNTLRTVAVEKPTASLNVFPNPSNGHFYVEVANGKIDALQIHDLTGKLVRNIKLSKAVEKTSIDIQGVNAGVYIVTMLDKGASIGSKKIIVE